jgi:signal transduction histidine kinase
MNELLDQLLDSGGARPGWHDDFGVVLLGIAAALFVVAGVVRLARWRLLEDPHSALVGSALCVVGGLGLPLIGVAAIAGALHHRELAEATVRAAASFIAVVLVHRALRATTVRWARPSLLLPLLATPVLAAFAALAALEASLRNPVPGGPTIAHLLSGAMVLGWLGIAAATRSRLPDAPWSRRAAPLFVGLGIAEALYGADLGELADAASLVVCTVVAVLCVRSAHLDLSTALLQNEQAMGSLNRALVDVRDEAVELSRWQASLVHDADNAVAGLRAALGVIDAQHGPDDTSTARLCRAAAEEVAHLDHLLHRSPDAPVRRFDVGSLVVSVGETARALGMRVAVAATPVLAVGRPDDVVVVLKNLLANARRHAPGASVVLLVDVRDQTARIVCRDDGPGFAEGVARRAFDQGVRGPHSTGSGLGLHQARLLMRAQGGDLMLVPQDAGACVVATLPTGVPGPASIPTQRSGSSSVGRPVDQPVGTRR